ncbi:hypothetical protein [Streptomyces sp. NPDC014676]|uniref:hypothetical protein n=1 Tax=Streptomyces sp. NPDC014676 TaxID=3364879 RepID=UPI0036FE38BD
MIVSAADTLAPADGTTHPTGYRAEEAAASHKVLTEAGHRVVIAGPTADPVSLDERGGVRPLLGWYSPP